MKITLTKNELTAILSQNSGLPIDDVVIEGQNITYASRTNLNLMVYVNEARKFRYNSDEKISAIKAVRDLGTRQGYYIGLADAKFFVESLA